MCGGVAGWLPSVTKSRVCRECVGLTDTQEIGVQSNNHLCSIEVVTRFIGRPKTILLACLDVLFAARANTDARSPWGRSFPSDAAGACRRDGIECKELRSRQRTLNPSPDLQKSFSKWPETNASKSVPGRCPLLMSHCARTIRIVELQDTGLREKVGGPLAEWMIRVTFDLRRSPLMRLDQHGASTTGPGTRMSHRRAACPA